MTDHAERLAPGGFEESEAAETPQQRVDRIQGMLDRCRDRGNIRLSHLEGALHDLRTVAEQHDALLAENERLRTLTVGLRQEWGIQPEYSTSAFSTRTEAIAHELAAAYSRVRQPGCKPTPHHVVTRFEGDWHRVDAAPQQPMPDGSGT